MLDTGSRPALPAGLRGSRGKNAQRKRIRQPCPPQLGCIFPGRLSRSPINTTKGKRPHTDRQTDLEPCRPVSRDPCFLGAVPGLEGGPLSLFLEPDLAVSSPGFRELTSAEDSVPRGAGGKRPWLHQRRPWKRLIGAAGRGGPGAQTRGQSRETYSRGPSPVPQLGEEALLALRNSLEGPRRPASPDAPLTYAVGAPGGSWRGGCRVEVGFPGLPGKQAGSPGSSSPRNKIPPGFRTSPDHLALPPVSPGQRRAGEHLAAARSPASVPGSFLDLAVHSRAICCLPSRGGF